MKTIRGIIHGKMIELPEETGLPEGQEVTIILPSTAENRLPGQGIRASAGSWAEDGDELDQYLEWNRQQRKAPRRTEP